MTYPDGGQYEGGWVNGMQQGFGRRDYPNGDWYEGQWEQGQRDGTGRLQHSGNLYDGMFRQVKTQLTLITVVAPWNPSHRSRVSSGQRFNAAFVR